MFESVVMKKTKCKKRKMEGVLVYCSVVRLFMEAAATAADIFFIFFIVKVKVKQFPSRTLHSLLFMQPTKSILAPILSPNKYLSSLILVHSIQNRLYI